jgi:hypothetical protein
MMCSHTDHWCFGGTYTWLYGIKSQKIILCVITAENLRSDKSILPRDKSLDIFPVFLILWTYIVLPFPNLLSSYNLPLSSNSQVFNLSLVLLGKRNRNWRMVTSTKEPINLFVTNHQSSHSRHGCLSAFMCRYQPCDGLIPHPRSPTNCLRIKKLKRNNAFHGCPMLKSGRNGEKRKTERENH